MKQVLSVADLATMLGLTNQEITQMKRDFVWIRGSLSNKEIEEERKRQLEQLNTNPYYQSLCHLKTALENLNVEIETPELKVEEDK